jgi:RNA polymerase-binding transcription factor DksA
MPKKKSATTARSKPTSRSTTTARSTTGRSARAAPADSLLKRAKEIEDAYLFINRTSFAGDEREVADELSAVSQHQADVASTTLQREIDLTARQTLEREREEIQQALKRRESGSYGICANCGRPIPKARLKARPEAIYCMECQQLHEARR